MAELVVDPCVPVTVIGKVPRGVDEIVAMVRLDVPPGSTAVGVNVAVAPAGRPVALSAT